MVEVSWPAHLWMGGAERVGCAVLRQAKAEWKKRPDDVATEAELANILGKVREWGGERGRVWQLLR